MVISSFNSRRKNKVANQTILADLYKTADKSTFDNFLLLEDAFLRVLPEIKYRIVHLVARLNAPDEQLLLIEVLLRKLLDPQNFRHLKFLTNLVDNANITLLEDCTEDGTTINKDLVLYIKKLNELKNLDHLKNQKVLVKRLIQSETSRKPARSYTKIRKLNSKISEASKRSERSDVIIKGGNSLKKSLLPSMKDSYLIKMKNDNTQSFRSFRSDLRETEATATEEDRMIRDLYQHILLDTKRVEIWSKVPKVNPRRKIKFTETGELEFRDFKSTLKSLLAIHKKCGLDCVHLKRFYERINYNPIDFEPTREEFSLPTKIIDRIMLSEDELKDH